MSEDKSITTNEMEEAKREAAEQVEPAREAVEQSAEAQPDSAEDKAEAKRARARAKDSVEPAGKGVKWLVALLRLLTGGVFIFSGFVKAVDPWGGYYKFQEYFQALSLESLYGVETFAAFAVAIVELMLGVALLIGAYRRGAPIFALAMMVVMLPLTLWLMITDAVPDCGCFGDALPLSNTATFLKNVVLTVALVALLRYNRKLKCLYGPAVQWVVLALTFLLGLSIALRGYFVQPLIDFRPFPVGSTLQVTPSGTDDEDYVFIYEKDGEQHSFTIDSIPDEEDGWTFVDRRSTAQQLSPAQRAATQSISIFDEGQDVTAEVLDPNRRQLLFLFPDIAGVSIAYTFDINELNNFARVQDVDAYGITSGTRRQIDEWNDISLADYPVYMADDSELKMLARGNPAVVYIERGKVVWKRTLSSIDMKRLEDNEMTVAKLGETVSPPSSVMSKFIWSYLLAMLALLVINRAVPVIRFFAKRGAKSENSE